MTLENLEVIMNDGGISLDALKLDGPDAVFDYVVKNLSDTFSL